MRLWCGVMLAACWSEAAFAQTSPLRDLDIFVGNVLSYDDNVFRTPDGVTRPGTRNSDWILEPTVSAVYTRPIARGEISLRGLVSYRFYRHNDNLNAENLDFGVNGNTRVAFCNAGGNASFHRQQSDLADIVDGGPLTNVENRLLFGGSLLCGDDIGIRPGVEYSHESVTNDSAIRDISDYRTNTYTARIGYSRPTLGYVSVYGTLSDGAYPNRPAPPGQPAQSTNDKVRTYSVGLAYNRDIGTRLSGSVSVGYMHVKPDLASVPGFKGLTYAGSLTYRGSDRISGLLSFSRSSQQSNLLGVDYTISTVVAGSLHYAFSQVVSLDANASYSRRRFQSSVFLIGPSSGNDNTKVFGLGLNFQSFKRLVFTLSGSRVMRNSDVPGFDYAANRVSLRTGLSF